MPRASVLSCGNCHADFSADDGWRPVAKPSGHKRMWRTARRVDEQQKAAAPKKPAGIVEGGFAFKTILRVFVSLFVVFFALLAMEEKSGMGMRWLAGTGAAACLFIVVMIGTWYELSIGLFCTMLGGAVVAPCLLDRRCIAPDTGLLLGLGALALVFLMLGIFLKPKGPESWMCKTAFVVIGVMLFLIGMPHQAFLGGLMFLGFGLLCIGLVVFDVIWGLPVPADSPTPESKTARK